MVLVLVLVVWADCLEADCLEADCHHSHHSYNNKYNEHRRWLGKLSTSDLNSLVLFLKQFPFQIPERDELHLVGHNAEGHR